MARAMKDSGIEWIGEIPEDWCVSKMKYLGRYTNGYAFKPEEWGPNGLPIIRIQDLTGSNDNPNYFCGNLDKKYLIQNGDILVSWAATLDAFIWNKGEGWLNQHIFKAEYSAQVVTKEFFFWMLKIAMENMNNDNKHGIVMQHVTLDVFNNFTVPLPPIAIQNRIAICLDTKCAEIDTVLEKTRTSIEEYKKLKQAVITQAVTKGVRGKRKMKKGGIEWVEEIPEEWNVFRVANLYRQVSENGNDELPILTVSINTGVSDRELSDEESDRIFVRSEDRSKYKKVEPGDLVYNMMRAWQGAFGAVRVNGMVSPAYVVARPTRDMDSRYVEYLFRIPEAIEEMHRYSYGVADFRLRLYWAQFRNIRLCVPALKEQIEIADYIDEKAKEIDELIAKKEQFITELENYKKSLIYEYVTGKKEAPSV